MADYLKLFMDKRLTPSEPHHLEFIKGRLAAMKGEGQQEYTEYSQYYGVDLDVKLKEKPTKVEVAEVKEHTKVDVTEEAKEPAKKKPKVTKPA